VSDDLSIPSPTYRVSRRSRGMDPATRRLALIAGSLGGVLLAVIGAWTVIGHRSGSVPVVQADSSPIRVKPLNPGGMQIAGASEEILSGGDGADGGKLAPPPEAPAPQAMRAPPPPPPVVATPAPTPIPAATPAPPKPVPAPVDRRAAAPARTTAPAVNHPLVQLAALASEGAAKAEWQKLGQRMPDLFGRRQADISKIERDGHTYWRVRTGGFSDLAQATQFCERVRAKGTGCSVADF
jgi:hypothetical protein